MPVCIPVDHYKLDLRYNALLKRSNWGCLYLSCFTQGHIQFLVLFRFQKGAIKEVSKPRGATPRDFRGNARETDQADQDGVWCLTSE